MMRGLILILTLLSAGATAFAANKITWRTSFQSGMKEARRTGKPMMVDFYADWCGWCKKLDAETYTDKRVIALAKKFVCVKVETDADANTALQFAVTGLPRVLFLNARGEIVADVAGFAPAPRFLAAMRGALKRAASARPLPNAVKPDDLEKTLQQLGERDFQPQNAQEAETLRRVLHTLINHFASRDAAVREDARKMLQQIGTPAIPNLIDALTHPQLAVRIEAFRTLRALTHGQRLDYDPWAPRPQREAAAAKWAGWWEKNKDGLMRAREAQSA